MQHARKIGHCVCDLTKTCPCDILREKDVCICAGESESAMSSLVLIKPDAIEHKLLGWCMACFEHQGIGDIGYGADG